MIKITPADQWFGKCIKLRAGWRCEVCGKQYQEGDQGLHTSHFYSRRHQSVRHDPDNAAAMCFGCHQKLGGEPIEFALWIECYLTTKTLEALEVRKNKLLKIKRHLTSIRKHYQKEFERLRAVSSGRGFLTEGLFIEPWKDGL